MFISRRCDLFRWSAVFRRCRRRRRLPLVHRLPPEHEHEHVTTSATISDHHERVKMSSDHRRFSLNPAQRDTLPHRQSQITVWSNYQTSLRLLWSLYHRNSDFITIYSKWSIWPVQLYQSMSRDQSFFVLIGQIAFSWYSVMIISMYKCSDINCWSSVKSIIDDQWQWLSFNA